MKKLFFPFMLMAAGMLAGCSGGEKEYRQEFDIDKKLLLVPIEDKAPDVRVWIELNGKQEGPLMHIRIARENVDYWMPVNVERFAGQKITLVSDNIDTKSVGLGMIVKSDIFDFDYNDSFRPVFHFSPKYGWTNDPNGMVYKDGEYHLYYQHNPYGSTWGNMHWGHAVTRDFKKWEHLPDAIHPDELGTIFSGSAIVDVDNTAGFGHNVIIAIYTADGDLQTQCIAYSPDNGRTFIKYDGNPVLSDENIRDFRDPKVFWHSKSNKWVMSLATTQTITFYGSENLKQWNRLSEFGDGLGAHGGVWECPDLFPLTTPDGREKWVLFVSINPGGPNGGSATQYFIGDFDGTVFTADELPYPLWLDHGRDNYAGVTWSGVPAENGRRIFIGWMSNWDYSQQAPTAYFRNAMTLPRELSLGNADSHLILKNYPLAEIFSLREPATKIPDVITDEVHTTERLLSENKGAYELEMNIIPAGARDFGFRLINSKGEHIEFRFDTDNGTFKVDRTKSGNVAFNENFPSVSEGPLYGRKSYKINLFIDKASAEIFINGGETVQTNTVFPGEPYNKLEIFSDGSPVSVENITVYKIK